MTIKEKIKAYKHLLELTGDFRLYQGHSTISCLCDLVSAAAKHDIITNATAIWLKYDINKRRPEWEINSCFGWRPHMWEPRVAWVEERIKQLKENERATNNI